MRYYVWHDEGCCDNVTEDLEEARGWEREFLDNGIDAYITDEDQNVINETVPS